VQDIRKDPVFFKIIFGEKSFGKITRQKNFRKCFPIPQAVSGCRVRTFITLQSRPAIITGSFSLFPHMPGIPFPSKMARLPVTPWFIFSRSRVTNAADALSQFIKVTGVTDIHCSHDPENDLGLRTVPASGRM
jgi:hypothetical protein